MGVLLFYIVFNSQVACLVKVKVLHFWKLKLIFVWGFKLSGSLSVIEVRWSFQSKAIMRKPFKRGFSCRRNCSPVVNYHGITEKSVRVRNFLILLNRDPFVCRIHISFGMNLMTPTTSKAECIVFQFVITNYSPSQSQIPLNS